MLARTLTASPLVGAWVVAALAVGCRDDAPTPTAQLDWDVKAPAKPRHDRHGEALGAATPADPLDLRRLELETAPAEGAEPGDWVRCLGGTVMDGARRFDVCRDGSQTWVDPALDRITIVVEAVHAESLKVLDREVRFVDGWARVEVDLRTLMAEVRADRVVAETALHLPVAIAHGGGVARGDLHLVTPRVLALLYASEARPLRFPGEALRPLPQAPAVMILEPEGRGVRYAPEVALAAIDVVAIDRGRLEVLPGCPGSMIARVTRPVDLVVIERVSGRRLGERRWPGATPSCDEPPLPHEPPGAPRPPVEELLEGIGGVLSEARARGGERDR